MARFEKGHIPWNKGKPWPKEVVIKMSESRKGKPSKKKGIKTGISWNKGKKGLQVAWNKGKKLSKEHRKKISEAHKGKSLSEEHKEHLKGRIPWNKGKKGLQVGWCKGLTLSDEYRKKMSEAKLKNPTRYWLGKKRDPALIEKLRQANIGNAHHTISHTVEARRKMSESQRKSPLMRRGKDHHNYVDGKSGERRTERHILSQQFEYKQWRKEVFERDDFTCQICGVRGVFLHPHHKKSWKDYKDERYNVDNGITLCVDCHHDIHGWVKKEKHLKAIGG